MGTNELSDLMHAGEQRPAVGGPDLDAIRRRGGRRRQVHRAATGVGAVATAAALAGAVVVGTHWNDGGGRTAQATSADHQVTGLSTYEKKVLREVTGSYAVDGTVIVPGSLGAGGIGEQKLSAGQVTAATQPLGFHAYSGGALPYPNLPAFMQGNPPKDSQVVADLGPVYLGCTSWPVSQQCMPAVLGKKDGAYYYIYGLGADDFLKPGADMEVFTDADYTDHVFHATVIGGFDGTTATRVDITTVNGQTVPATVDRGRISAGDTMFWATLPADAASVTAYDADGKVVATHKVRACSGGVDCEVR